MKRKRMQGRIFFKEKRSIWMTRRLIEAARQQQTARRKPEMTRRHLAKHCQLSKVEKNGKKENSKNIKQQCRERLKDRNRRYIQQIMNQQRSKGLKDRNTVIKKLQKRYHHPSLQVIDIQKG